MGFSHIHSPNGLSNTSLSQGYVLEVTSTEETVDRMYIPRTGEGVKNI